MFRWFRLFLIFVSSYSRGKVMAADAVRLSFRVLPQETDKKYMNNACFWTITEMGQMDLFFRTGMFKHCRRYHWWPLVGSQKMVYKKPLKRFDKYILETRMIYWDDKWIYYRQSFIKDGQLVANSVIKVIFRSKDGNIPVPRILSLLGIETVPARTSMIDYSDNIDKILSDS